MYINKIKNLKKKKEINLKKKCLANQEKKLKKKPIRN